MNGAVSGPNGAAVPTYTTTIMSRRLPGWRALDHNADRVGIGPPVAGCPGKCRIRGISADDQRFRRRFRRSTVWFRGLVTAGRC